MITGFFWWWYADGLKEAIAEFSDAINRIVDFFSLPILLKTLFAPWKGDVLSAQNISLGDQVKLWEQNAISRLIGFLVRLIVICIAITTIALTMVILAAAAILWLVAPVLIMSLPLIGLKLVLS